MNLLGQALQPSGDHRLLDAGCGTGWNLEALRAFGTPVGVDLAAEAVAFCRQRGVAVLRGSLAALPFVDGSFDCVSSLDVLYHAWVTDDQAAVREMARVLKPGGVLFVRVPALESLRGAHDEEVFTRHRYTRGEVEALVRGAGLVCDRLTYANVLLMPLMALRRPLDRLLGREGSDVGMLPPPIEWLFRSCLELEARWLRRLAFPIGASVIAVAHKPVLDADRAATLSPARIKREPEVRR